MTPATPIYQAAPVSMPMYLHRCMVVPAALAPTCRALVEGISGSYGAGMFTVPLSPTGELPATHFISSGQQSSDFCALVPLAVVTDVKDEEGRLTGQSSVTVIPGKPDEIVALALKRSIVVSLDQIAQILESVDVSEQCWSDAIRRLGLKTVKVVLS